MLITLMTLVIAEGTGLFDGIKFFITKKNLIKVVMELYTYEDNFF